MKVGNDCYLRFSVDIVDVDMPLLLRLEFLDERKLVVENDRDSLG